MLRTNAPSGRVLPQWSFDLPLIVVFGLCVYRAATQSVVFDEAYTFIHFVARPFSAVFSPHPGIANNHLLNTLLARVSVAALGPSAFALRLPALAGAVLYLTGVRRLVRLTFDRSPVGLLTLIALVANPLIADFLVAARGYGMGLGFTVWAMVRMFESVPDGSGNEKRAPGDLAFISVLLALSSLSILAFTPLNLCLALVFASCVLARRAMAFGTCGVAGDAARLMLTLGLPGGALFLAGVVAPHLLDWDPSRYFIGRASLGAWARDTVSYSLVQHRARAPLDTSGAAFRLFFEAVLHGVVPAVLVATIAACGAGMWRVWNRRSFDALTAPERTGLLGGATLVTSLAGFVAGHVLVGLPYPVERTGLQLVVLFLITFGAMLAPPLRQSPYRPLRLVGVVALAALVTQFVSQTSVSDFRLWRYDRSTSRLIEFLATQRKRDRLDHVRVAASWFLVPSIDFYRIVRHLDWLERPSNDSTVEGDAFFRRDGWSYWVLVGGDRALIASLGLEPLWRDPEAGVVVAGARRTR
jgi:hypothetical protein